MTKTRRLRSRTDPLRCVSYVRVSTTEQAESGASLNAQAHAIARYAGEHGYTIVQEFIEPGASATSDRRPVFSKMMESIIGSSPKVNADAVLVYQTSRFMRDVLKARLWKGRLEDQGVRVIAVQQDTGDSAQAHMVEGLYEVFDEFESRLIGTRTTAGMRQVAREGFFPGARPPYGYSAVRVESSGGRARRSLKPNALEAEVLREVFSLYVAGSGAKSVARQLNARGMVQRNGKRWSKTTVLRVITERASMGTYLWGKQRGRRRCAGAHDDPVPIPVEPIVDPRIWAAAQQMRAKREPANSPGRTASSPMLLARLVRCGKCGTKYMLETSGKRSPNGSRPYRYYNCRTFLKKGKEVCEGHRVPERALDDAVLEHLSVEVFTTERVRAILKDLVDESGILRQRAAERRKLLRSEMNDVERKVARWVDLIESGELLPEAAGDRLVQLRRRKQELAMMLGEIVAPRRRPAHLYTEASIRRFRTTVRTAFKRGGTVAKNYVNTIVDHIVLDGNHVTIVGKSAETADLLEAANAASPPQVFTEGGEVLASVPTWLRMLGSNQRQVG